MKVWVVRIFFSFLILLALIGVKPHPVLAACDSSKCDCSRQYDITGTCLPGDCVVESRAVTSTCAKSLSSSYIPGVGLPSPNQWLGAISVGSNFPSGGLDFITKNLIPFLVSLLLFILITLSLIFLIIGGIRWITNGGDKEGLAKAKGTVTFALIGLILGLGSFTIISTVSYIFNVDLGLGTNKQLTCSEKIQKCVSTCLDSDPSLGVAGCDLKCQNACK